MMDGYIGWPTIGLFSLVIAFAAVAVSVLGLLIAHLARRRSPGLSETFATVGYAATFLTTLALTAAAAVLVYCFLAGDISITYVVENRSDATGSLALLYRLSGVWAGREGSLLFWAWLISLFNSVVAARHFSRMEEIDTAALLVAQLVLTVFAGLLLFSEDNIPFVTIDDAYIADDGSLTGAAELWGMSSLLEHWAMAIHPPALFIGYAGLTIPFAYALAAVLCADASAAWVRRAGSWAVFSWLFLTAGIALGAVWAYTVLGWGGYWGWDPVENASLIPWLVSTALVHSLSVCRTRGIFGRWSLMCACLAFSSVVFATFITRSGLIESVHAFAGDAVSLVLFLALIICSLLAGAVGLAVRWKMFASTESDDLEALPGKYVAYYVNNLVCVLCALLLAYLTVASALPSPLPLAGMSVSSATYEAIARPLTIVYLALAAICPLLSWTSRTSRPTRTSPRSMRQKSHPTRNLWQKSHPTRNLWQKSHFVRRTSEAKSDEQNAISATGGGEPQARTNPHLLICALLSLCIFIALCVFFALHLAPAYDAQVAAGGSTAETLAAYGPRAYYFALTIAGFLVASLLFMNALYLSGRALSAGVRGLRARLPQVGGGLAHAGMAVLLVGLISSSMYATDETFTLTYDEDTDSMDSDIELFDYTLVYSENAAVLLSNDDDVIYEICFDVYDDGEYVEHVSPSITYTQSTMQSTTNAVVVSRPVEDLFVVFSGTTDDSGVMMEVRVNPLVKFVWLGAILLAAGMLLSLFSRRTPHTFSMWQKFHSPRTMWQKSHFVRRASEALPDEQNGISATGGGEPQAEGEPSSGGDPQAETESPGGGESRDGALPPTASPEP